MKTAVLIPCYNEAQTIRKVVEDFRREIPDAEIWVYDNNSTDGTGEIAGRAGAFVRREYRQGKGFVVRSMFAEIDADAYVLVDGDDTYPAEAVKSLLSPVLEGCADMTVGDRLTNGTYRAQNKRRFHDLGNSLVRGSINLLFHADIRDVMTGYRAFSRLFVKNFPVMTGGFEIETEMTIHALDKNLKTVSFPVQYRDRPEGSVSKLSTIEDGAKVLRLILRLFRSYRPLLFFGLIAMVLIAFAMFLILPILVEFHRTGLVPRFPTLFMAGFIGVSGLLSLGCGMILDAISSKERREFEYRLQQIEARKKQLLDS